MIDSEWATPRRGARESRSKSDYLARIWHEYSPSRTGDFLARVLRVPSVVTCGAIRPGFVRIVLVGHQSEARAAELGIPMDDATTQRLVRKQPIRTVATADRIGAVVALPCTFKLSER